MKTHDKKHKNRKFLIIGACAAGAAGAGVGIYFTYKHFKKAADQKKIDAANAAAKKGVTNNTTPVNNGSGVIDFPLSIGSGYSNALSNNAVKNIQIAANMVNSSMTPIKTDGLWGTYTDAATISAFAKTSIDQNFYENTILPTLEQSKLLFKIVPDDPTDNSGTVNYDGSEDYVKSYIEMANQISWLTVEQCAKLNELLTMDKTLLQAVKDNFYKQQKETLRGAISHFYSLAWDFKDKLLNVLL